MVPEGKEKKRKAGAAAAPTIEQKKSKKSKLSTASKTDSVAEGKAPAPAPSAVLEQQARSDIRPVNGTAAVTKSKTRKRAADFLSDAEDAAPSKNVEAVAAEVPQVETVGKAKSKKSKKTLDKEVAEASTGGAIGSAGTDTLVPAATPQVDSSVPTETPKKGKKKDKDPAVGQGAAATIATKEKASKRGPTPSETAAKKMTKLFNTPVSAWPTKSKATKKTKKAQEPGDAKILTADGLNGVHGNTNDEKLEAVAGNATLTTSMQEEAQVTTEKELEDEWESEDEKDDQGAALLAGFDSDGDDTAEDVGLSEESKTMAIPNYKKTTKKLTNAAKSGNKNGPGTVYVGRIPHGFYEHQMRDYFSQFGTITKLRLSRNRTTGASKHFAFIEFDSDEVAKIVAETMDNYLMFGHILKCKYAPQESLHADLWKGANRRFNKVPYNKLEKKALEAPKTKEQWDSKITKEQRKREAKAKKLREIGYEIELPKIKTPEEVLERRKLDSSEEQTKIDAAPELDVVPPQVPKDEVALQKTKEAKKSKKGKKGVAQPGAVVVEETETSPVVTAVDTETTGPSQLKTEKRDKRKEKRGKAKVAKEEASRTNGESIPAVRETVVETISSIPSAAEAATRADPPIPITSEPAVVEAAPEKQKKGKKNKSKPDASSATNGDMAVEADAVVITTVTDIAPSVVEAAKTSKSEKKSKSSKKEGKKRKSDVSVGETTEAEQQLKSILKKPKKA